MKIAINNQQNLLKINKTATKSLVSFFMRKASRLMPDRQWHEVSVVVADDKLMVSVNEEFMGSSATTDVLSFCLPPMPENPGEFSGEIFVNAEAAIAIAGEKASGRELALYMAHACDHLMDEDDSNPISRRRMRNRELRWLREADTLNLFNGFVAATGKGVKK